MKSIVQGAQHSSCPTNAFWNGQNVYFCAGYETQDIVVHEWTHGTPLHVDVKVLTNYYL